MRSWIEELKYIRYFLFHPINGFWEIKKEKKGSLRTALLLVVTYLLVSLASAYFTAYIFNENDVFEINVLRIILPLVALYLLWCVASWCLTSLFDGEGSFYDICVATAYSLLPIILIEFLLIFASHAMSLEEAAFYQMFHAIGYIWTGILLFLSTVVTHQYTFTKSIGICFCTLLGICIILYVGLLFTNLLQQMLSFVFGVYNELSLRS